MNWQANRVHPIVRFFIAKVWMFFRRFCLVMIFRITVPVRSAIIIRLFDNKNLITLCVAIDVQWTLFEYRIHPCQTRHTLDFKLFFMGACVSERKNASLFRLNLFIWTCFPPWPTSHSCPFRRLGEMRVWARGFVFCLRDCARFGPTLQDCLPF